MSITKNVLLILTSPFALLYALVIKVRNFCYDRNIFKSRCFNIPIISIGNISVGGTGKTPHSEFLFKMLESEFCIAILSRGYKRKTKGFRIVEVTDSYRDVGDESLQIKRKFPNAIVAVCEDRVKGVEKLLSDFQNLDLVILDDAFQHRKIKASISIVLNDFNHSITKDFILPMGRLREPRKSIYRADIIINTKCPPSLTDIDARIIKNELNLKPFQDLFYSSQKYLNLLPVFSSDGAIRLDDLMEYNVLLVTGIARSKGLFDFLNQRTKSIRHIAFSDHHNFKKSEIQNVEKIFKNIPQKKIIILTEKDAVRIIGDFYFSSENLDCIYYIPIEVFILGSEKEYKKLETKILRNVRANKRID